MQQLTKALVEWTMEAELAERSGYEKYDQDEKPLANPVMGRTSRGYGPTAGL
jgi:hypothetical protein